MPDHAPSIPPPQAIPTRNHLFLVRHGENPANITKEFSNRRVDHSLTEKGVLQAQQTAAYFKDKAIQAIFSSPLKRAAETATVMACELGLEVVILEAFREVDVGLLEGRPATAADLALYQQVIDDWFDGKADSRFPEGDDYHTLWARVQAGFRKVISGIGRPKRSTPQRH